MTLAKKTVMCLSALTLALLAAGGAAIWCLLMLRNLSAATHEEFEELRAIRPIEHGLWEAALQLANGERAAAYESLGAALTPLARFERERVEDPSSRFDQHHASRERSGTTDTIAAIQKLRELLRAPPTPDSASAEARTLSEGRRSLNILIDEFERAVAAVHSRTSRRFGTVLVCLVILFAVVSVAAAVVSLSHYRAVIGPLHYIRDGVRTLAEGSFRTRLQPRGDAEFVELQADFNRMATELESLYTDLEQRVADQGRRLAISERLASVGFLAAGVAHEINNPLAIMSGYAESVLRRLRQQRENGARDPDVIRDIEIIRDEAFRAKKITGQLLELSSGGDPQRSRFSLWSVVDDVAVILRRCAICEGVTLETTGEKDDPLFVFGSEPEIKQVVLNLTMNAAQAAHDDGGRVELCARRSNGWIELCVRDDGRGMTPETLQRVFEPFYTRRARNGGVGLGLTISHAIVRRHHGELHAASDGAGRGSAFTLRLPAEQEETLGT